MMSFSWDETQNDLIGLVQTVCKTHIDWASYLGQEDPTEVDHTAVWKLLTDDVGLRGLSLPVGDGGHGESWKTVGAVVYALSGYITAVPVLSQWVAPEALLAGLGDQDLSAAYLSSEIVPSVAVPACMSSHEFQPTVKLDGGLLVGTLSAVPAPVGASDFLLLAEQDGRVHIVRTAVDAATVRPMPAVDVTRPYVDVAFDGAPAVVLRHGDDAERLWGRMLCVLEAMVSLEQAGLAATMLTDSVQYATERKQFGRPICTNQVVRHQLADMWMNVQEAQSIAMYLLNCLTDNDPDLTVAVCMARAFCADAARRTAETAGQIHGGMGFAWETPLHLGLKRAVADALWLGTPARYRRRLRDLVDL